MLESSSSVRRPAWNHEETAVSFTVLSSTNVRFVAALTHALPPCLSKMAAPFNAVIRSGHIRASCGRHSRKELPLPSLHYPRATRTPRIYRPRCTVGHEPKYVGAGNTTVHPYKAGKLWSCRPTRSGYRRDNALVFATIDHSDPDSPAMISARLALGSLTSPMMYTA